MAYQRFLIPKSGSMLNSFYVYTEFKENWQYFFNEPTMTPDSPGDVDKILDVRAHTVRRGPGDPAPFSRKGHQRVFARVAKSKGSARPGDTYIVGEKNPLGTGYREKRQFAILGDDIDVQHYAKAKAKMQITLWDPRGGYAVYDGVTVNP